MQLYKGEKVNTIYFGGGTPTALKSAQIARIVNSVHTCFCVDSDSEITIEANPGTIDSNKSAELFSMGFNRVSLGAQSMIDSELKALGRLHCAEDTVRAFAMIANAGFSNISLDLMYAIPGQNMETLSTSADQMLKLKPDHISCYGLKIEEGTVFGNMLNRGELMEKSDDEYADMYELITKTLAENNVNMRALSIADTQDFGILRLIVNDNETATKALTEAGYLLKMTDVVGVKIGDQPGKLSKALEVLDEANINMEYLYAFMTRTEKHAYVVLRVADNEKAEKALEEKGFHIITDKDVDKL
jgi:hypothetical protein